MFEPAVFRNLVGYIERGEIRPVVASVYALRSIVAAQQEFSAKGHTGKIVLSIPQPPDLASHSAARPTVVGVTAAAFAVRLDLGVKTAI